MPEQRMEAAGVTGIDRQARGMAPALRRQQGTPARRLRTGRARLTGAFARFVIHPVTAGRVRGPAYDLGLERMTRIELAFSAWEADVLPLNYIRGAGPMLQRPERIS